MGTCLRCSCFRLTARTLDKEITILADQVLEVRAGGTQLIVRRKRRTADPVDDDTYAIVGRVIAEAARPPIKDEFTV